MYSSCWLPYLATVFYAKFYAKDLGFAFFSQ